MNLPRRHILAFMLLLFGCRSEVPVFELTELAGVERAEAMSIEHDRVGSSPSFTGDSLPAAQWQKLIGRRLPEWELAEWSTREPLEWHQLRSQITVIRFWTSGCPYCDRSVPAVEQLAEEFRDEPVQFIGIYHSKPLGSERPWSDALAKAREWNVSFPIAYDRHWKTVHRWWLDHVSEVPTSVTFVVDDGGCVRHIHPGPEFHPSDDPQHRSCDEDYQAMRRAIRKAVADLEPELKN